VDVGMDFQVAEGFAALAANFAGVTGKAELVEDVRLELVLGEELLAC
jgi:hypothetical protein